MDNIYTIYQVNDIIDQQVWHSCIANNEKDGKYCYGTDTILLAFEEDEDYCAEFVGNENDGYYFKFYI